ncbi:hypothetical protein RXV95_02230 [Novosphingobium sp. ZN18A2]|uniref:hypothetical protein n=1 Tax=Novosphingobium sp. ZN18A2 TaxID=3079861 RepID=UPI0030D3E13B
MTATTSAIDAAIDAKSTAGSEAAWRAMRHMNDIQFAPVPDKADTPPQWPEWLQAIGRFLADLLKPVGQFLEWLFGPLMRAVGAHWNGIEIALALLACAGAVWIAWMLAKPWLLARRKAAPDAAEGEWTPGHGAARALLEDADRLAAEGRFAEAAHLLLQRSVGHIADTRPEWLAPSSTAREIGRIEQLPSRARVAFAVIAAEVERSLFALHGLSREDWQRARDAYADFALADLAAASPGGAA